MIRQWLIQGSDQISFPRVLNLGYETYPITLDGFSFFIPALCNLKNSPAYFLFHCYVCRTILHSIHGLGIIILIIFTVITVTGLICTTILIHANQ